MGQKRRLDGSNESASTCRIKAPGLLSKRWRPSRLINVPGVLQDAPMLITIGRYLNPWEAHVLRGRLEAEGIPAFVTNDAHAIAAFPLSYAFGGTALQVPASRVDEARGILRDYASGALEDDLRAETGLAPPKCARCGSTDLRDVVPVSQKVLVVMLALWSATFPTRATATRCNACNDTWEISD